jgi:4a-hydroxytetrahydrobiopterin dehydratase
MKLSDEKCVVREKCTVPLDYFEVSRLVPEIPGWKHEENMLIREFTFRDFPEAIDFVNRVARLAEEQDHHPDICVFYNRVRLTLFTHKVNGLTRNDFVLAAKISEMASS